MNNLGLLLPDKAGRTELWTWATVTSINPIKVRIDGDTAALAASPDSLYKNVAVGHRVWVQLSGHRVIIHGAGGSSANTAGIVEWCAMASAPDGYLICNGVVYNISDYPILGPKLGSTYGGNGTTTFGVPDLRGRVPVGVGTATGAAGATNHPLAQKSGEETHVFTINEMPPHDHGGNTNLGVTDFLRVVGAAGTASLSNHTTGYASAGYQDVSGAGFPGGSHYHSIASQGGGAAANNMQPYLALTPIIRTF